MKATDCLWEDKVFPSETPVSGSTSVTYSRKSHSPTTPSQSSQNPVFQHGVPKQLNIKKSIGRPNSFQCFFTYCEISDLLGGEPIVPVVKVIFV